MRRVKVYVWKRVQDEKKGSYYNERVFEREGVFHKWGCSFEEFDTGPGNFSTAIIELSDGSIKEYEPEMVEFMEPVYEAYYGEESVE